MKNVIEILERYYQSFINQSRDWDFFLGLADYVKYLADTPSISGLVDVIIKQMAEDEKVLDQCAEAAINEIKQAQGKIFKIIRDNGINYASLNREIKEYEDTLSGRIVSSRPKVEDLHWCVKDVLEDLFINGHKDLFKDFAVELKGTPGAIERYTFAPAMSSYEREKEIFENKRSRELWGAWENIVLVYQIIFRTDEEILRGLTNKGPGEIIFYWSISSLMDEMDKIKEGKVTQNFKPIHFVREKYVGYASRVHNYLLKELNKEELPEVASNNAPARFSDGKLYFRGEEIDFNGKPNQKDLLVTLFKNPKKNWDYDEVQEDWDIQSALNLIKYPKNYWKKFYSAGDDVNQAVAVETQIKDFIVKNTKQIRIKPEYV